MSQTTNQETEKSEGFSGWDIALTAAVSSLATAALILARLGSVDE